MTDTDTHSSQDPQIPTAIMANRNRRISIVWLIPFIALLIGVWLAYTTISQMGPTITIMFKSAKDLEAGKTRIKYKDVELGKVTSIQLSDDLSHVIVKAEMSKQAEKLLSDHTKFWVVRARVAATGISGLGTLFSGAYISMDPGPPGKPLKDFNGSEDPPAVTTDAPGMMFSLQASRRGSLEKGSPVFYRQIDVGQVTDYHLSEDGTSVNLQVFINDPYHKFVYRNTRFWNASGVEVALNTEGIKVHTDSVVSLLIGGISFGIPQGEVPGKSAENRSKFLLYESLDKAKEKAGLIKEKWLLYFDESVRGLSPGAPVELQGIRIGQVLDVHLEFDREKYEFRIPVLIELEPERVVFEQYVGSEREEIMEKLVEKGYRAQLDTGNLLTSQQMIVVSLIPDAPPAGIVWGGPYPVFPTIPKAIQGIKEKVARIIDKIDRMPIRQIGDDLRDTIHGVKKLVNSPEMERALHNLDASLEESRMLLSELRTNVAPQLSATIDEAKTALEGAGTMLKSDSPLQIRMNGALDEVSKASRSLHHLLEYLERHPESLISGKGDTE
ncbi:MAG: MCE family protein [Desulfobacteraceae bacterium]|nr:MAG: MCE family protein [Desulfobacteraceae bacterium]